MIELPSGRKVEIAYREYNSGSRAVYVVANARERVAHIAKTWNVEAGNRFWLNATVTFYWSHLTQNDMADYNEVVRLAVEEMKRLDEELVPGTKVEDPLIRYFM